MSERWLIEMREEEIVYVSGKVFVAHLSGVCI